MHCRSGGGERLTSRSRTWNWMPVCLRQAADGTSQPGMRTPQAAEKRRAHFPGSRNRRRNQKLRRTDLFLERNNSYMSLCRRAGQSGPPSRSRTPPTRQSGSPARGRGPQHPELCFLPRSCRSNLSNRVRPIRRKSAQSDNVFQFSSGRRSDLKCVYRIGGRSGWRRVNSRKNCRSVFR